MSTEQILGLTNNYDLSQSCIRFVDEQPEDWDMAEAACVKQGARLVTLNNMAERNFIATRSV
jgi:hypothetical protein